MFYDIFEFLLRENIWRDCAFFLFYKSLCLIRLALTEIYEMCIVECVFVCVYFYNCPAKKKDDIKHD